jgi:hypothetical protein
MNPVSGDMVAFSAAEGNVERGAGAVREGNRLDPPEPGLPRGMMAPILVIKAHLSRGSCRSP